MAFSRLKYDNCYYRNDLAQSIGEFSYVMDPSRYVNCSPCRMERGIVGGNDVSLVRGNMVDVESDLKGQTRMQSKCPTLQYLNPCPAGDMNTCQPRQIIIRGNPSNMGRVVDTTPMHLRGCQMFRYTPIPVVQAYFPPRC